MAKENGIKIAVRSLVVQKDKEFCIGCQKPNKTRYMIIDKDKKQASAFSLAQKFYGLPFAAVDQNRQTYMCRVCYRLIKKYYNYTEKARKIRELLQKTSANLETVVIIKQKDNLSQLGPREPYGGSQSTEHSQSQRLETDAKNVNNRSAEEDVSGSLSEKQGNKGSSDIAISNPRRSSRTRKRTEKSDPHVNKTDSEMKTLRKRPHESHSGPGEKQFVRLFQM